MRENLLNILSESNKDIDNQKLMDYISGRLNDEEKHEVEKWMIDNPFFSEAMEGLQAAGDEQKLIANVNSLNAQLRRYLQQKKQRREKKLFPVSGWTLLAVIFIVTVAAGIYLLIRLWGDAR